MLLSIVFLIFSSFWLVKATKPFSESANFLGKNVTEGIKGATINAAGSSMPELLTTTIFLFFYNNEEGFAAGIATTLGSSIYNLMFITAISIFLYLKSKKNFKINKKVILRDSAFFLIVQLVLYHLLSHRVFTFYDGIVLLFIYTLYVLFLFRQYKKQKTVINIKNAFDDYNYFEKNDDSFLKNFIRFDFHNAFSRSDTLTKKVAFLSLTVATIEMALACYLLVVAVEQISNFLRINSFFIAVVIAAIATSIPDTILSFKDAKDEKFDDAISNAIGSNIFDIAIGLGLPVFVYGVFFGDIHIMYSMSNINELKNILLGVTFLSLLLLLVPKKIGKSTAVILFSGYLLYVVYIFIKGALV